MRRTLCFYFFEQSNLKKIKSIDTYIIGIMETKVNIKKKVSKRRRTKRVKFTGGSEEEFWEIMRKYGKIEPDGKFDNDFGYINDADLALLAQAREEEDHYFAENP